MDMNYTKNALDYTQILTQLKERGLLFKDEERAVELLSNISYFRIANYLRYFEIDNSRHLYKPDTYFEDAVCIYYFDKKLRNLLFTAIQSIEVSLRSKVIHHVALSHGPFWFADSNLSTNKMMFTDNLNTIKREIQRSKEDFIQEHFRKYSSPDVPPVWKTLEVTSFGTLSKLICNLNDNHIKKQIARQYNLPQHQVLESWIKCIVILRNCLAHHARVWNRRFPQMPQLSMRIRGNWVDCSHIRPNKLYAQLCCLTYLLDNIYPNNNFKAQIKNLLNEYPEINLHHMGFPNDWEKQSLWL
ncbi:MAG: Abi family protein [Bacteroidaceae bacterium]|nr:Abi family protein [Bacteroidaceae bacterium]